MPAQELVSGSAQFNAVTTTQTLPDLKNALGRGIKVFLVTSAIGTGSITVSIYNKDPGSGTYVLALAGAAVVTNTTNTYTVYPTGIAAVANVSAVDAICEYIRIQVVANNANAASYSLGWALLP